MGSIPLLNSTVTLRYFSVDSHDVTTEQCLGLTVHTVPSHENVRAGRMLFYHVRLMSARFYTQFSLVHTRGVYRKRNGPIFSNICTQGVQEIIG